MAIFQNAIVTYKAGGVTPDTFNPSDKDAAITLSNGNLTATWSSSENKGVRASHAIADGQKLYFEITLDTVNGSWGIVPSVATSNVSLTSNWTGNLLVCGWRKDQYFTYLSSNNIMPGASQRDGTSVVTANFGASSFSYSVPTDFSAGWGAAK